MSEIKFLQAPDKTFNLPLERIILLSDSPIPNGAIAMREVDENHLATLMEVETDKLPPIKVALIQEGAILVDGRHRVTRAERKGEETILSQAANYNTAYEVLNDAFNSNIAHGLPLSIVTRTAYGIWLHITPNEKGEQISIRQAAKIAGVSHVAIIKAMKKLESDTTSNGEKFSKDSVNPSSVSKLGKALYTYFKEEHGIFSDDMYGSRSENIRARSLANHFKQAKNVDKSLEMLQSLARSIQLASDMIKQGKFD